MGQDGILNGSIAGDPGPEKPARLSQQEPGKRALHPGTSDEGLCPSLSPLTPLQEPTVERMMRCLNIRVCALLVGLCS